MKQQQQEEQKNTEIQNQQKERPTQENKGFESKCKKNKKNLQKNSVFWNITTKLLQQNLIEDIKNTNVHN